MFIMLTQENGDPIAINTSKIISIIPDSSEKKAPCTINITPKSHPPVKVQESLIDIILAKHNSKYIRL